MGKGEQMGKQPATDDRGGGIQTYSLLPYPSPLTSLPNLIAPFPRH
jgi:hypothetical protein